MLKALSPDSINALIDQRPSVPALFCIVFNFYIEFNLVLFYQEFNQCQYIFLSVTF